MLAAFSVAAASARAAPVDVSGNVAILDSVYLTVLGPQESFPATREGARRVEERLASFLHHSGYDLAVVHARAADGRIEVEIDEGTLDKVIVLGTDLVTCLRMRLDLSMAGRVYNRPEVERRLGDLREKYGVDGVTYELVPIAGPEQDRPRLVAMTELHPLGIADAPRRYELRVRIANGTGWAPGVTPSVEVTSLEGGAIGAEWRSNGPAPESRMLVQARVSAGSRGSLDTTASRLALSSADVFAALFAPPLTGDLRPAIGARVSLLDRQRQDLGLDGFHFATLQAVAFLQDDVSPNLSLWMGGGLERRLLLSVQRAGTTSPAVDATPRAQTRPFGALRFRYRFDPETLRRDRGDVLQFDARLAAPGGGARDGAAYLRGRFQHVRLIGWDEFWVQGVGNLLAGDVFFTEEESLGADALRGAFSGTDYTRRLLGIGFEYRYSFWRDVFKLGLFTNLAVYQPIDPILDRGVGARFAASAGPGIHMLVEDTIAFDAYLSIGVDALGRTGVGAQLGLHQAF